MKTRAVFLVFSVFASAYLLTSAVAYAAPTAESCFGFDAGTNTITDYYDNEANNPINPACPRDVEIPATIGGSAVVSVGALAFNAKSLTSVVIPVGVTQLGMVSFSSNQIASVVLPSSLTTIGDAAFSDNSLTSISIPASVTAVGGSAFIRNELTSIASATTTATWGDYVFQSNNLTTAFIPPNITTIPKGFMSINSITSLTIPTHITVVDDTAFSGNRLTSLTIPSSVTTIGQAAFSWNELSSLVLPNTITSLGSGAFGNNLLTSLTLSNGLTTIPLQAFSWNILDTVTVPHSITSIASSAFEMQNQFGGSVPRGSMGLVYQSAWYARLYTEDPANPNGLTDGYGLYREAIGDELSCSLASPCPYDANEDGDTSDELPLGGHLINPSTVTLTYTDVNNKQLLLSIVQIGTGDLDSYAASLNQSLDMARYYRIGQTITLSPEVIDGYTAPPTITLVLGASTTFPFVYALDVGTGNTLSATGESIFVSLSAILIIVVALILLRSRVVYYTIG